MMVGVWGNEERYHEYYRIPGWYISGDQAYQDEDGYIWFLGRRDDIIKSFGYRVSPYEVERVMNKRIAAVALQPRIGEMFAAVVTGVTPKGVFVRVLGPPAEGLLVRGQQGVDVGDQLQVKLVSTDPRRGYIDFAR